MATRWRWPPASLSGRDWTKRSRPTLGQSPEGAFARLQPERTGDLQRQHHVLQCGEYRHQVEALEHETDAPAAKVGQGVVVERPARLPVEPDIASGGGVDQANRAADKLMLRPVMLQKSCR
jgi:hypothetical protein